MKYKTHQHHKHIYVNVYTHNRNEKENDNIYCRAFFFSCCVSGNLIKKKQEEVGRKLPYTAEDVE